MGNFGWFSHFREPEDHAMDERLEDSTLPDSEWWQAFREALLAGDLAEKVGRVDPSAAGDALRDALARWMGSAGPGRAIEDRITDIEFRLKAIEASQERSARNGAATD